MMRYSLLALLIAGPMAAGMAHAQNANSSTKITFTGIVTDQTCKIAIGGNETGDVAVPLNPVKLEDFTKIGDTAGRQDFTLSIDGCKDKGFLKGIKIKFKDTQDVDNSGYLKNIAATPLAEGIALRLSENVSGVDTTINPKEWTKELDIPKSGAFEHKFSVAYVSTNKTPKVGNVKGVATVEMSYF